MDIIEDYIQYLEEDHILFESKWKALLKTGNLSKTALRKIQKFKGKADPLYVKQLIKQGKYETANKYLKK